MIKLTDEQQLALDAAPNAPVPVVDERTAKRYVLVQADVFERLCAVPAAAQVFPGDAYPLMDAVARQEGWDDPVMASYDVYGRNAGPASFVCCQLRERIHA